MVDTRVTINGLSLDNPIIPASGTFGYGYEFAAYYDIRCLGSFSMKGTTRDPRYGNPLPRIAECPSGMLNAVGLQNPGVDEVVRTIFPQIDACFGKPIVANVSGFSLEEYQETCARLDAEPLVGWIEVNVSCPNVHGGGMRFGVTPDGAAEVTRAVKAVTHKPVWIKLTPNVTDIVEIAQACEAAGADGLSLINTVLGMRIDVKTRRPVLSMKRGGLSGPALFPMAVRMVYDVYEAVQIPIIGMGGVQCADDVIELMLAGATAVQVGAANLVQPWICRDIVNDLPVRMAALGIERLNDVIGGAHTHG